MPGLPPGGTIEGSVTPWQEGTNITQPDLRCPTAKYQPAPRLAFRQIRLYGSLGQVLDGNLPGLTAGHVAGVWDVDQNLMWIDVGVKLRDFYVFMYQSGPHRLWVAVTEDVNQPDASADGRPVPGHQIIIVTDLLQIRSVSHGPPEWIVG